MSSLELFLDVTSSSEPQPGLQWRGEVVKQRGELYSIQLHVGIEIHIKDLV